MIEVPPGRPERIWLPLCHIAGLSLVAIGALGYLVSIEMRGGIRTAVVTRVAQRQAEIVPLPRARPDEPAFTGSTTPRPTGAAVTPPTATPDLVEYQADPPKDTLAIYLGDADAVLACEDKVRAGLAFPNSLNRLLDTTATRHVPGDGSVVTFAFDAVNGLGFPLHMQAECVLDGGAIARLDVGPRWDSAAADQSVFSIPPSTK